MLSSYKQMLDFLHLWNVLVTGKKHRLVYLINPDPAELTPWVKSHEECDIWETLWALISGVSWTRTPSPIPSLFHLFSKPLWVYLKKSEGSCRVFSEYRVGSRYPGFSGAHLANTRYAVYPHIQWLCLCSKGLATSYLIHWHCVMSWIVSVPTPIHKLKS